MYYLGLDMGTNSVGWAVTDKNYKLLRAKGKDLWGIREFEEASTAVDRRTNRISRRRRQRAQARMGLLKIFFEEAISKVDPLFFIRLDNSKYYPEDKADALRGRKQGIFDDEDYKDADYYKEYPTIFHLRKELIENTKAHDVRLVYLAISNMFKHRGHFLEGGFSGNSDGLPKMEMAYRSWLERMDEISEDVSVSFLSEPDYVQMTKILGERSFSKTRKTEELMKVLAIEKKNKTEMEYIKAICGRKVDCKKMFLLEQVEEKLEIDFSEAGFEEKFPELQKQLGDEYGDVLEKLKSIYDIGVLTGILGEYSSISEARVASYEAHKVDLKMLKSVIKKYCTEDEYKKMFSSDEKATYSAYVRSYNSGKKERRSAKERKQEDLYKTVKNYMKKMQENDPEVCQIKERMENGTFLPKQLTSENGVIPNQIHRMELERILENAERYLPFLKEKDASGLSVSERIVKLFSFHMPYYVGPVSENSAKNGGNGWVVRKAAGEVFPWNLEEKIDLEKTKEEFIMRLVKQCTYLSGEKVLPKESLMYQQFMVLNEINNLKIDGQKISVEMKQKLYREIFEKGKKVTRKGICRFFKNQGWLEEDIQLSGVDVNLGSSLASYGKFYAIFGEELKKDSCRQMTEEIIRLATIYGDSKKELKKQLESVYGDKIDAAAIKRILGMKFKDWGKLSKEFLELEGVDEAGESRSLLQMLWETNFNLMELLHEERFGFKEALEDKQERAIKPLTEFQAEDLDAFYFSAPVKRMIWQTLRIIEELKDILGKYPERIFVEMTRSDEQKGDKGRKDSRKKQFLELYKKVKDETRDWAKLIEAEDVSGRLRSKKMYLYLTQMGRCMYSGRPIDLDQLFDNNLYDIDHIYPRSQVKDDNLANNLVLVEKKYNATKSADYPLDSSIRGNQEIRKLWKGLREKNLITEEKYRRLTGSNPFTEEQRAAFIARQLVETSQGTKGVADLLKQMLPDTTIVYAKARNVSDFRHQFNMHKCRIVNDFHHANDAYLNIVVGNVYFVKFTQNPLNYIKKEFCKSPDKYHYNLAKMFERDVERDGEIAWIAPKEGVKEGTLQIVKDVMKKNSPLMTRLTFEGHGGIANATLYSKRDVKDVGYIPLKASDERLCDVKKYGGFTSVSTAYFFLVEHTVKKKRIRTIETVPIYLKSKLDGNIPALENYCREQLGLSEPSVRVAKIKMQSLLKRDGYEMYLSGKTNKQYTIKNAINMMLLPRWVDYIKKLEKDELNEEVDVKKNIELYDILTEKYCDSIFKKRPNPVGDKLKAGREKYVLLSLVEQCKVIREILKLSVIGNTSADLTLIGCAAKTGVMLISNKVSDCKEFKLINQSITGVYEQVIDLLTV